MYYKDVINHNIEDQNYLSILTSVKKKISIAKIRTNSYELHSETGGWSIPKTPWDERVCHLCDTTKVEDEKHFLLDCPAIPILDIIFKIFVTLPIFLTS
jgi:hypothetical protein